MLLSVVYATLRLVLEALLSDRHRDRDLELLVLRHQLWVLRRTAPAPRWTPATDWFWRPFRAISRATHGHHSLSLPRPSCAGTGCGAARPKPR